MRRALLIFGLFSLLVGCDQATKHAALTHLREAPQVLVEGVFELRYAENRDTAFSLFRGVSGGEPAPWVMGLLASLAIAAIGLAMWRRRDEAGRLERAGMLLILSGAVGNLIDRFSRGFVVDFFHLRHWPIFNVADVLVVAGIIVWLVATREQRYARAP